MTVKHRPEQIGSILETVLGERGYLTPCREWDVVRRWPGLVGPKLASVTECDRVENGVLYVRVASAAWRQEISYLKQRLLDTIAQETPCGSISDIVFY
jgi:predicted nucleic acid-binding Zn ribbon protein